MAGKAIANVVSKIANSFTSDHTKKNKKDKQSPTESQKSFQENTSHKSVEVRNKSPESSNSNNKTLNNSNSNNKSPEKTMGSAAGKNPAPPPPQASLSTNTNQVCKHSAKRNLAVIEKWVASIDNLLNDPDGFECFRKFLIDKRETTPGELTRHLDFWRECYLYKIKVEEIKTMANHIFDTYLDGDAQYEVGTEGATDDIWEKLNTQSDYDKDLFTDAQVVIRNRLERGEYILFCNHLKVEYKL